MRTTTVLGALGILVLAGPGLAEPIGRLTCAGPLKIAGEVLPVDDIPAWVILPGDEIETLAEPAFLLLRDRTRVVLSKQSLLVVSDEGGSPRVRLMRGELSYKLLPGSSAVFYDRERRLPALETAVAHLRAGAGRIEPPGAPPVPGPPANARSRSESAPGQNR